MSENKLHRVVIENPLFGAWEIYTNCPEMNFKAVYDSWCDDVKDININSLCLFFNKRGYTTATKEVLDIII